MQSNTNNRRFLHKIATVSALVLVAFFSTDDLSLFLKKDDNIHTTSRHLSTIQNQTKTWTGPPLLTSSIDSSICAESWEGVRGYLKENAVLTVIVNPKDIVPHNDNNKKPNDSEANRLRHLLYSWSTLPNVNFLIATKSCAVTMLAYEYNLPVLSSWTGSDVEDLTYRHLFTTVKTVSNTPYFGFANGDILFDETLPQTIQAAITYQKENRWRDGEVPHVSLIGHRFNSNAPLIEENTELTPETYEEFLKGVKRHNTKFFQFAQDYFFFDATNPLDFTSLPPFLLGGTAFDNYLSALLWKQDQEGKSMSVDSSRTLKAYHLNHDSGKLEQSHGNTATLLNHALLKEYPIGEKGSGILQHRMVTTYGNDGNEIVIGRRK